MTTPHTLYARARGLICSGAGQSPAVQAAYARSGAALLVLAVETAQECPGCRAVHDQTAWARDGMDDTQRPVDYGDELDPFTDENGLVWVPGQWPTRGPM